MAPIIKPSWVLTALGFVAGTAFGALAFGGLGPRGGESASESASVPVASASHADPESSRQARIPGVPSAQEGEALAETARLVGETGLSEDQRVASILASWRAAESQITDLQIRLAKVERALATRTEAETAQPPRAPETPQSRRDSLVAAGVSADLAEDIVWRESRVELDRLHLRDQAAREGWLGTERYREALNNFAEEGGSVREEIGDSAWDRYLYLTGEDNRVSVASVIPGSAAEAAGLQSGDLIEGYAGGQPFDFNDLRQATTEGERGELVAVRIRRGDRVFDAWVPRGPLGVRLGMTRVEPLP